MYVPPSFVKSPGEAVHGVGHRVDIDLGPHSLPHKLLSCRTTSNAVAGLAALMPQQPSSSCSWWHIRTFFLLFWYAPLNSLQASGQ